MENRLEISLTNETDEELIQNFDRAQQAWNALKLDYNYNLSPRDAAKIGGVGDEVVVNGLLLCARVQELRGFLTQAPPQEHPEQRKRKRWWHLWT